MSQTIGTIGFLPYFAMLAVVIGNVMGNVLLKLGASADGNRAVLFGLFGWQVAAGIGCFAAAILVYAWSLKHLPLHLAQSIAALQFVGAVLAAALVFNEALKVQQWTGIACIIFGLFLIAR